MMTPKEKAEELVNKFIQYVPAEEEFELDYAKQCALIAVDEMIHELTKSVSPSVHGFRHNYWEEVKQEIEKL